MHARADLHFIAALEHADLLATGGVEDKYTALHATHSEVLARAAAERHRDDGILKGCPVRAEQSISTPLDI